VHQSLFDIDEVKALIQRGNALLLAGDEAALKQLPPGNWIGGTIPYFMTEAGGLADRRRVFVTGLPDGVRFARVRRYGEKEIAAIYSDLPSDGFGVMIAPAASRVHLDFAVNGPNYPRFAMRPLVGWISGVHLSELGTATPRVFDGTTGEALEQHAVVMHAILPPGKAAELGIINIFEQGDGPTFVFPETGFSATTVEIDGRERNLAEYVKENSLDTRLPLVADYCGASINVSFQGTDPVRGEVRFYAPVFAGVRYRHARPVSDYVEAFLPKLPKGDAHIAFSCNCILNYIHSGLEGKKTGSIVGPITFGEVAYQLLNQTVAYLSISDAHK
jgi:hypothetical protein